MWKSAPDIALSPHAETAELRSAAAGAGRHLTAVNAQTRLFEVAAGVQYGVQDPEESVTPANADPQAKGLSGPHLIQQVGASAVRSVRLAGTRRNRPRELTPGVLPEYRTWHRVDVPFAVTRAHAGALLRTLVDCRLSVSP